MVAKGTGVQINVKFARLGYSQFLCYKSTLGTHRGRYIHIMVQYDVVLGHSWGCFVQEQKQKPFRGLPLGSTGA